MDCKGIRLLMLVAAGQIAWAQQPPPAMPAPGEMMSPERLNDLVAPIALYPDPLLSQVLVAATYPLELVRAFQWLERNRALDGAALAQAAEQENWDPSVQALVLFPDVLRRLNQDITWTTNLGNAFLSQQADVMDAVQRMRLTAQRAGRLASNNQQTVTSNNDVSGQPMVEIEPSDPNLIYVPDYDPGYVWGPPIYYPYPAWRYPRYGANIYLGFGLGISIGAYLGNSWGGWGAWGWHPGWRTHNIIVNNNFIYRHNFNANRGGMVNGRSDWAHNRAHREGVPYANPALTNRYRDNVRQNLQTRPPGASGGGGRANPQTPPTRENHSAFGGVREGAAARTQSDHGYSTMGPTRSASPARGGGNSGGGAGVRGGGGNPGMRAPQGAGSGQRQGGQGNRPGGSKK